MTERQASSGGRSRPLAVVAGALAVAVVVALVAIRRRKGNADASLHVLAHPASGAETDPTVGERVSRPGREPALSEWTRPWEGVVAGRLSGWDGEPGVSESVPALKVEPAGAESVPGRTGDLAVAEREPSRARMHEVLER
ncbi:MAG: hypothetical protein M3301_09675, partial [Chloroflexota bacterium]|nr:hypothetical protein [Chloroflexota bacterium]